MESRCLGFLSDCLYIYEFVEEVQDATAAWEDRDKTELVAAGLDEVGGSSFGKITSVMIPLPHFFAWTLELESWARCGAITAVSWASDMWGKSRSRGAYFPFFYVSVYICIDVFFSTFGCLPFILPMW